MTNQSLKHICSVNFVFYYISSVFFKATLESLLLFLFKLLITQKQQKKETYRLNITKIFYSMGNESSAEQINKSEGLYMTAPYALGQKTDGLSGDCQVILVGQRPQRLVEQLLCDRLKAVGRKT